MDKNGVILTDERFVDRLLPKRDENAHKGCFGRVLIIAGGTGYTGAPALCANAALRSGAGLIFTGVPKKVYPIVAAKLDEPMVFPLPCTRKGMLSRRAVPEVLRRLKNCDACLLGPGLGRGKAVFALVKRVLAASAVPVILDADAINALENRAELLKTASCPVILTPHEGEFRRISNLLSETDRQTAAERFSEEYGVTLLLKGHRTVICGGGRTFINTTGNPGMATGGSGDVLAGILLSLLGQRCAPAEAAAAAAWLHGAAGDFCANAAGEYGLAPTDIIANLPVFLK